MERHLPVFGDSGHEIPDARRDPIGSEYIEPLNGIRLETDATHLYAVATDRYTLAVARYRLNDDEQGSEPIARTIPAKHLRSLREWTGAQNGSEIVTISTTEGRLNFETSDAGTSISVDDTMLFVNWRSVLRGIAQHAVEETPYPALDSRYLARFTDTGDILRARATADEKAFMVVGEDFIGLQMPAHYAGLGRVKDKTFEQTISLWNSVLGEGDTTDMADAMPSDERRSPWAPTDIRESGAELLKQVLHSSADMLGKSMDNPDEFHAHVAAGVHAWMAYRYLAALHTADPRLAAVVVGETAEELDSGELGEFAFDAAKKNGHDPQKWIDDHEAFMKKRAAEKAAAAEKPVAAPTTA